VREKGKLEILKRAFDFLYQSNNIDMNKELSVGIK
jgi:hypothetical protein